MTFYSNIKKMLFYKKYIYVYVILKGSEPHPGTRTIFVVSIVVSSYKTK